MSEFQYDRKIHKTISYMNKEFNVSIKINSEIQKELLEVEVYHLEILIGKYNYYTSILEVGRYVIASTAAVKQCVCSYYADLAENSLEKWDGVIN